MLSLIVYRDAGELPEFKLRMPASDSSLSNGVVEEETLCGYLAHTSLDHLWLNYRPTRFYRLVYRRGKTRAVERRLCLWHQPDPTMMTSSKAPSTQSGRSAD